MNRLEFMQKLESLISDITESEREEALQYYNDYLNDAGVENEQEVLESLGTPEKLARTIRESLNDNSSAGEFTESGYRDQYVEDEKNEMIKKDTKKPMSGGMIALIVLLCIFASPLIISIASGILGTGVGILAGMLGLFLGVAVMGFVLFIVAILLIVFGIVELFSLPLAGFCLIGLGLLFAGLSLFFIWLTVWFCGSAIPWMIRGIVQLFNNIFHKKGGEKV